VRARGQGEDRCNAIAVLRLKKGIQKPCHGLTCQPTRTVKKEGGNKEGGMGEVMKEQRRG